MAGWECRAVAQFSFLSFCALVRRLPPTAPSVRAQVRVQVHTPPPRPPAPSAPTGADARPSLRWRFRSWHVAPVCSQQVGTMSGASGTVSYEPGSIPAELLGALSGDPPGNDLDVTIGPANGVHFRSSYRSECTLVGAVLRTLDQGRGHYVLYSLPIIRRQPSLPTRQLTRRPPRLTILPPHSGTGRSRPRRCSPSPLPTRTSCAASGWRSTQRTSCRRSRTRSRTTPLAPRRTRTRCGGRHSTLAKRGRPRREATLRGSAPAAARQMRAGESGRRQVRIVKRLCAAAVVCLALVRDRERVNTVHGARSEGCVASLHTVGYVERRGNAAKMPPRTHT